MTDAAGVRADERDWRAFAVRVSLLFAAVCTVVGTQLPFYPVWLDWRGLSAREIAIITAAPLVVRTLVTPTHKITAYTGHRGPEPYGELFDLANDPHELYNLWDDPAAQTLKRDLIVRLHHRLAETDIALPRRLGHA